MGRCGLAALSNPVAGISLSGTGDHIAPVGRAVAPYVWRDRLIDSASLPMCNTPAS